jgi:hypothetical protein
MGFGCLPCWYVHVISSLVLAFIALKGKYCVKFTDPCIFEENGEEEPILNFISYIMMMA